jgi:hypothetical protein
MMMYECEGKPRTNECHEEEELSISPLDVELCVEKPDKKRLCQKNPCA